MQAKLVGAERLGDGYVLGEGLLEPVQIADIVYALFEVSHIARGQTHDLHTQPLEFAGNIHVLGQRRNRLGLVDAHLHFEGPVAHRLADALDHAHGMRHSTAIFDGRAHHADVLESDEELEGFDGLKCQSLLEVGQCVLQLVPRERLCHRL